jgi:hypothetical protein
MEGVQKTPSFCFSLISSINGVNKSHLVRLKMRRIKTGVYCEEFLMNYKLFVLPD